MGAPKYNVYALNNDGGRPAYYDTPEKLDEKVSEYFQFCVDNKEELTMSGLVLYLGFSSRSSLRDYRQRSKEFSHIIERATMCVEKAYEMELHTFKWGGGAFALRNINSEYWKEETSQDVDMTANITADFGNAIQPPSEPA
jgi:hypothetical protein